MDKSLASVLRDIRDGISAHQAQLAADVDFHRLGEGPCPGDDDGFYEDGSPNYHPADFWEGKHDFDDGICWRCSGIEPNTGERRHEGFHLSMEAAKALLDIVSIPDDAAYRSL